MGRGGVGSGKLVCTCSKIYLGCTCSCYFLKPPRDFYVCTRGPQIFEKRSVRQSPPRHTPTPGGPIEAGLTEINNTDSAGLRCVGGLAG